MSLLKFLLILVLFSQVLLANDMVGTITQKRGSVEVFSNPSTQIKGNPPHALYNGLYYSVQEAKVGMKIDQGNIIRTGKASIARIVFANGDQYIVGPGTEYSSSWKKEAKKTATLMNLVRGKVRAVISKGGPRSNLNIQTKTASMGVRGTDFYVTANGYKKSTVSVLRGEVSVKPKVTETKIIEKAGKKIEKIIVKEAPEIKVSKGFVAEVKETPKEEISLPDTGKKIVAKTVEKPMVNVRQTSKVELASIQKNTVIRETQSEKEQMQKTLSKEVIAKIEELDKKSVSATLTDIKHYDPALYNKLKEEKVDTVAAINTTVVKKIFETAPERPAKATEEDFEDIKVNAYEEYFDLN